MEYTVDAFVDKLIYEKGIHGVPDDVMVQIKSDLAERAENLINAGILANMPEEKLEEFEKKLDEGMDQEIQDFCRTHIPNLDEVVAEALATLQRIYLTDTLE